MDVRGDITPALSTVSHGEQFRWLPAWPHPATFYMCHKEFYHLATSHLCLKPCNGPASACNRDPRLLSVSPEALLRRLVPSLPSSIISSLFPLTQVSWE